MPQWKQVVPSDQSPDPYLQWASETNFVDLFAGRQLKDADDPWLPVIVELADSMTVQAFATRRWNHRLERSPDIAIPDFYAHLPEWARRSRYCTAVARHSFLNALNDPKDKSLRRVINRVELGLPLKTPHEPTKFEVMAQLQGTSGMVVTGIIDDGLAFANERFRHKAAETRIEYFWNQDGLPTNPPPGFMDGWELSRKKVGATLGIDDYLKKCTHRGIVDEDEVYALTNHIDYSRSIHKPVAKRAAHGTHVMDVAAGYSLGDAPKDSPIICVQLPVATTADTSGASLGKYGLEALLYILLRADSLASKPPPVVVNLSYGMIAGPHDGSSIFESAVDEYIRLRTIAKAPLSVAIPAGNSRLSRCHASFTLAKQGDAQTLQWRVLPDDLTPSFVEIWLPDQNGKSPACEVLVTTPTGDVSPMPIRPGDEWVWMEGTDVLCKVLYLNTTAPGRKRDMVFIALAPTATLDPQRKVAPFGTWTIKITSDDAGPVDIDAWVQRDDTPYGYPQRGRQSRFDDDERNYPYWAADGKEVEVDSPASYIQRDGSMNAIGTGCRTIIVGGFKRKDWKPAKYSSSGPVIHPPGRGLPMDDAPDAVAVSDESDAHPGIMASGTRSSSKTVMNGTSVAAPQITRWVATQIGKAGWSNRDAADQLARLGTPAPPWPGTRTEANPPANAPAAPVARIGSGRVDFPAGEFPSIIDRQIEK